MNRAFAVLFFSAAAASAAEPLRQNTLTADEAASGWLLLFDGKTTFGWHVHGDSVTVKDDMLLIGGKDATIASTTTFFADGEWRFQYRNVGDSRDAEARVKGQSRGLVALKDKTKWIDAAVRVENGKLLRSFSTDEKTSGDWIPDTGDPNLVGPLRFVTGINSKLEIRNIKFKPLGTKPLFSGKDLSGWKKYTGDDKRQKSTFTVSEDGWLTVENGPGDLQTVGQWADFVLQLECRSNGTHLNSGIFFRCLTDQYQQGYEVQIRNQWTGDDRTKPVDFGTGAIYRRQPARIVVSSDREWFTLTLIAHGNHMATWVNGFPVADFTDTRDKNENGRNGSKTNKGAISIQGHDPTTNLSFRHFRLAEYPESKP
jgi:hypothetical protein